MTMNISVLGLNTISASVGLALGSYKDEFQIRGYDTEPSNFRIQNLKQSFKSLHLDPASCVAGTQVIFLSLPSNEVEHTLLEVKDGIPPETVIICLTPTKVAVSELVKKILGPSIQFTAVHFIFPPGTNMALNDPGHFATAILFEKITAAIATSSKTTDGALGLVAGLCTRLGAVPYFCDMLEMDGLISTTTLLPHLVSSAFIYATLNAPGRQELEKFAGDAYHSAASAVALNENNKETSHDAILHKEHVIYRLDSMISALEDLKSAIAADDEKHIQGLLETARSSREKWLSSRNTGSPGTGSLTDQVMPEKGDYWRQQLGVLGRKPGKGFKKSKE